MYTVTIEYDNAKYAKTTYVFTECPEYSVEGSLLQISSNSDADTNLVVNAALVKCVSVVKTKKSKGQD